MPAPVRPFPWSTWVVVLVVLILILVAGLLFLSA